MAEPWTQTLLVLPSGRRVLQLMIDAGPVVAATWQALEQVVADADTTMPLLLASQWMQLPVLSPEEQSDWVAVAGTYRKRQQQFKQRGGRLISLVTDCLIGGTYLVHGMGASRRMLYGQATVYPALSEALFEQLFDQPYPHKNTAQAALAAGLATDLVGSENLLQALDSALAD